MPAPVHQGFQDTHRTAELVAEAFGISGAGDIVVCSTGLIGELLPMDQDLLDGVDLAVATSSPTTGGPAAATAIMTTDTVPKTGRRPGAS
jgi:glutamate N-acetyltransferase/amino-acid N-acetyltransferase